MREHSASGPPSRAKVVTAFAAVYLIWGSTYIAIRFAIETLPPFLMAGFRFMVAGAVLYGWARLAGAKRPARIHWATTTVIGGLLISVGNGAVVWAEQRVASGLASLLIATVPIWIVLLDWIRRNGTQPGPAVMTGVGLGFAGLALLIGPEKLSGIHRIDPAGATVLVMGAMAWAAGSLYSLRAALPESRLLATAMEMLMGGALIFLAGLATDEWTGLHWSTISARSAVSLGYLIVFGSLVGFTAYIWLLNVTTPARASTYAYVNPVVAVILGRVLAGEPLSTQTVLAAAVIVAAVAVITTDRARTVAAGKGPSGPDAIESSTRSRK
ncbi:MAG: EamA family transporter [Nitrospirae bacterium]|nr:EamA family transporter [Nitrospirota bacterium]